MPIHATYTLTSLHIWSKARLSSPEYLDDMRLIRQVIPEKMRSRYGKGYIVSGDLSTLRGCGLKAIDTALDERDLQLELPLEKPQT